MIQHSASAQDGSGRAAAYSGTDTVAQGNAVAVANDRATGNATSVSDQRRYQESIKPLLKQACFDCHSGDSVEGNFRADELDPDLVDGGDTAWWLEVYSVLSKGEMPPPESSELTEEQRIRIVDWLSREIQAAEKLRRASGSQTSFRRLTRYEYNYALQDLLGVPWTFARDLPAEASEDDGFENNADSLQMSVKQVETYHRLALEALRRITVRGDRPPVVYWSIPMKLAFQREKNQLDRSIRSIKEKSDDAPEEQARQIERVKKDFQASADRSHYVEVSTGLRAEVDWDYRKASYAFSQSDAFRSMSEPGSYFAVVQPGSRQALTVELGDGLPDTGSMRVRIRASRAEGVGERVPNLQLSLGFQATDQGRSIKRVSREDVRIDAPFGQPEIYQWDIPLSEIEYRNTYRGETKLGAQPSPSEYIRFTNSTVSQDGDDTESSAVLIDHVEVAAPVYDEWPPRTHRDVFVGSRGRQAETDDARQIIAEFIARAWRRPPTSRDIERKLEMFRRLRPSSRDFQEAIVDVLAAVLSSPKFLYVLPGEQQSATDQAEDRLSQYELATRLSLFLWCSVPDDALLTLASEGRLGDREILLQQVDRMLTDPRSSRFSQHFVEQWLKMQPLEYLKPTRGEGGLDAALLESVKQEPVALFGDMMQRNASVLDFIDADYVVVNERLAQHYQIPGIQGNHFRRVALPVGSERGGVLTQAGLLMMNSDGEDSHPVKRGVWLLTSLLNDPPPPPPPAVPEIDLSDPKIASLTLKERIEDHRNHAACLSCHRKIDPWGIAFENYDASGRWRDQIDGKRVDSISVLPDNASLDGILGLKEYLVEERREQFVRATVEKMSSFALGRRLGFGDRAGVTDVTRRVRESGDGIRSLVTHLVTSELFERK